MEVFGKSGLVPEIKKIVFPLSYGKSQQSHLPDQQSTLLKVCASHAAYKTNAFFHLQLEEHSGNIFGTLGLLICQWQLANGKKKSGTSRIP